MPAQLLNAATDGVVTLTLDRAEKRNALTRTLLDEFDQALKELNDDPPRVLFLQSSGPVFCAGMDLGEMQERARSPAASHEWLADSQVYARVLTGIYQLPCPTVAVVQGPALAGGLGLVLACDIVLASETAYFSLPEPARGIVAAIVTPLLIHRVGLGVAHYLLLSGERCSAHRAQQWGLCHDVVPLQELPRRAALLTSAILAGAASAYAKTKEFLQHCQGKTVPDRLETAIAVSAEARNSAAAREGLDAFLEKRPPSWQW